MSIPDKIPAAMLDYARPDSNYLPVYVQLDPNWPVLARFKMMPDNPELPIALWYSHMFFSLTGLGDEGVSESVSVQYATSDVPGRCEQYKTYIGTGNREISLTLGFVANGDPDVNDDDSSVIDPLQGRVGELTNGNVDAPGPLGTTVYPARWLDSLKQPLLDPTTGLAYPPPPLILGIGNLLQARVILTQSTLIWRPPFQPVRMLPFMAEMRATFTVVRTFPDDENSNASIDIPFIHADNSGTSTPSVTTPGNTESSGPDLFSTFLALP